MKFIHIKCIILGEPPKVFWCQVQKFPVASVEKKNILENYTERRRLRVHGFNEEGSTTTPFEMLRMNAASRYDIAIDVASVLNRQKLVEKYRNILSENHKSASKFGEDFVNVL